MFVGYWIPTVTKDIGVTIMNGLRKKRTSVQEDIEKEKARTKANAID